MQHRVKSQVGTENVSSTLNSNVVKLIKNVKNIIITVEKKSLQHIVSVVNSYMSIQSNIKPILINLDDDTDSEIELDLE